MEPYSDSEDSLVEDHDQLIPKMDMYLCGKIVLEYTSPFSIKIDNSF